MIHPCASGDWYAVLILYWDPLDYPRRLVMRRWTARPGLLVMHGSPWVLPPSDLERLREVLRGEGFVSLPIPPESDPTIIEEWIPAPVLWGRE